MTHKIMLKILSLYWISKNIIIDSSSMRINSIFEFNIELMLYMKEKSRSKMQWKRSKVQACNAMYGAMCVYNLRNIK
jgi:hypothetical protein